MKSVLNLLTKERILGFVRHTLTAIGGYFIAQGLVDENTVLELSGALMTIIGTVWSIIDKKTVELPKD